MRKELTSRELEVLKLAASGRTSRQIAGMLKISDRTVEGHRSRAMMKLGLSNAAELIRYAVRSGIIEA